MDPQGSPPFARRKKSGRLAAIPRRPFIGADAKARLVG